MQVQMTQIPLLPERTITNPHRDGGPLSNFSNETIVTNADNYEQKDFVRKQEQEDIDFTDTPYDLGAYYDSYIPYDPLESEYYFNQISEPQRLEIQDADNYSHVVKKTTEIEESDQSGFAPSDSEDNPIALGIDYDDEAVWERRFMRYVMNDKIERRRELQSIEQKRRELEIEKQNLLINNRSTYLTIEINI